MPESIEASLRKLKLGGLAKEWRSVKYLDAEQYLSALLELELKEREVNRINRMVRTAGFNVIKTVEDFVWSRSVALPNGLTREYMEQLQFIPKKENLIFLGSVGTGTTHLATGLALKACEQGKRTRFFTAASLANILLEKNQKGTLAPYMTALKRVELMVMQKPLTGSARQMLPLFHRFYQDILVSDRTISSI